MMLKNTAATISNITAYTTEAEPIHRIESASEINMLVRLMARLLLCALRRNTATETLLSVLFTYW